MATHTHHTPHTTHTHHTHTHTHTHIPVGGLLPSPRLLGGGECEGVERTKGSLPVSTLTAAPAVEGGSDRVGVWPKVVWVAGQCLVVLRLISLLT